MKTTIKPNYSNSHIKEFLVKLNIAFVTANIEFITNNISDDVIWHIVGDRSVKNKENFIIAFKQMSNANTDELTIDKIITHSNEAAVCGNITMGTNKYAFSDFYEFSKTKKNQIKSITSYSIELKSK